MTDRVKQFVKVNAERLMVIGPITAPMAVAWTGQAGFAEDILGWVVPFTILFAAAWELSTAFVGWMYHQARQGGDAGTLYRVSTWIFALGAAVMNFWHASGQPVVEQPGLGRKGGDLDGADHLLALHPEGGGVRRHEHRGDGAVGAVRLADPPPQAP